MMDYAGRVREADTYPKLLRLNAKQHGGEIALREKDLGLWRRFTWNDYQGRVRDFALGLVELGLGRGDVIMGSAGFIGAAQADPGFDQSDATRAPLRDPKTLAETDANPDGFQSYLVALRSDTIAFQKPVVLVYGDSHYFRIDKPLQDSTGKLLENFTRVETFGDNALNGVNDVHWVKALVDPQSRDVFAFQAQTVPGNVVAHATAAP